MSTNTLGRGRGMTIIDEIILKIKDNSNNLAKHSQRHNKYIHYKQPTTNAL